MRHRFRLFEAPSNGSHVQSQVSMSLGDVARILADAHRCGHAWLEDLADDEVRISADLYEVLSTYDRMRKSA